MWQGTEAGTPQGAIVSPVLANLTLDGLEAKLRERYPQRTRCSRRAKVNLVRFADDCAPRTHERRFAVEPLESAVLCQR
jgi:RNA-directed DNA polymerase